MIDELLSRHTQCDISAFMAHLPRKIRTPSQLVRKCLTRLIWVISCDVMLVGQSLILIFLAAAHQQAPQKPATAIAAVGPFEHKPHGTPTSPPSNIPTPQKPQEIDIKLVERNGGSGQSSPNVSGMLRQELKLTELLIEPIWMFLLLVKLYRVQLKLSHASLCFQFHLSR